MSNAEIQLKMEKLVAEYNNGDTTCGRINEIQNEYNEFNKTINK